jgi:nicotinamide riboside transporter PnuC
MRRRKRTKTQDSGISKPDRMKRLAACCGIAGFLLACLVALLNFRQYFQPWQTKLLAAILIVSILVILAYGSLWVWICNLYQRSKGK